MSASEADKLGVLPTKTTATTNSAAKRTPEMLESRAYLAVSDSCRRDPPDRLRRLGPAAAGVPFGGAGGAVEEWAVRELVITHLGFWFGACPDRRGQLGCGVCGTAQVERLQDPEQIQRACESVSAAVGMVNRAGQPAAGLSIHLDDHSHLHSSPARRRLGMAASLVDAMPVCPWQHLPVG